MEEQQSTACSTMVQKFYIVLYDISSLHVQQNNSPWCWLLFFWL
jgi:hypothetical protein